MRSKEGFIKTEIADKTVVIPVGDKTVDFSGIISLNETGAFLWDLLLSDVTRDTLTAALLNEYEIGKDTAEKDIDAFLQALREKDVLCD